MSKRMPCCIWHTTIQEVKVPQPPYPYRTTSIQYRDIAHKLNSRRFTMQILNYVSMELHWKCISGLNIQCEIGILIVWISCTSHPIRFLTILITLLNKWVYFFEELFSSRLAAFIYIICKYIFLLFRKNFLFADFVTVNNNGPSHSTLSHWIYQNVEYFQWKFHINLSILFI